MTNNFTKLSEIHWSGVAPLEDVALWGLKPAEEILWHVTEDLEYLEIKDESRKSRDGIITLLNAVGMWLTDVDETLVRLSMEARKAPDAEGSHKDNAGAE